MGPDLAQWFPAIFGGVLGLIVMVGLAIGLVFLIVAVYRNHQRRRAEFAAWAAQRSWVYVPRDDSLTRRWRGRPFGRGSDRRAKDVLTGSFRGCQAVSFTYSWTEGSGEDSSTYDAHIVAIALPATVPGLELSPEGVGAKVAKFFGGQDIQFESEDFNRRWRVTADDRRFAHDVVHPRVMEWLCLPGMANTSIRFEGSSLLTWRSGKSRLADIEPMLHVVSTMVDAVPGFVWQNLGVRPPRA